MPRAGYDGMLPGEPPMGALRPAMERIKAEDAMGAKFSGPRGTYKIVEYLDPTRIKVKYLDGDWKGKTVEMSALIHHNIQQRQGGERSKNATKIAVILDAWWIRFPHIYRSEMLYTQYEDELLERLMSIYPELVEDVQPIADQLLLESFR